MEDRWPGWFEPITNPIETHFCVADTRMTVFRSTEHWVIFFELVEYNVGTNEYEVGLCAYSDCLQAGFEDGMGLNNQLFQYYRHPFEFDEEMMLVDPETASWILGRDRFSLWLNGRRLDFTPNAEVYAAAGIIFDEEPDGPDTIQPEQLLRFLCHRLDHPFFNSEDYLRSVIDAFQSRPSEPVFHQTGLSHHLSLFLQTREWQHTDFDEKSKFQFPREVPGFQILARAIASGDLTEWNGQDRDAFNTDWQPWEAIRIAERAEFRNRVGEQTPVFASYLAPCVETVTTSVVEAEDEDHL